MIMRLYGFVVLNWKGTPGKLLLGKRFCVLDHLPRCRSCGYGVPLFDYKEDAPPSRWAENKDGVAASGGRRMSIASTGSRPVIA